MSLARGALRGGVQLSTRLGFVNGKGVTFSAVRRFSDKPAEVDEAAKEAAMQKAIAEGKAKALAEAQQVVTPWHVRTVPDRPLVEPERMADIGDSERMPEEHRKRTVTIYRLAQTHMQSATHKDKAWRLKWDSQQRWMNPLMGWRSSADPMSAGVNLKFESEADAIRFCEKRGWNYEVQAFGTRDFKGGVTTYAHNFLSKEVETRLKKRGKRNTEWLRPKANRSNYFRPLTYTGEKPTRQHGPNMDAPIAAEAGQKK